MKRINLVTLVAVVAIAVAAACGGQQQAPPPPTPDPNPDSIAAAERARQDSLSAAEQARQDSIRRAQEEAERMRRASDEEAARIRSALSQVINFDFDRSEVRSSDAAILDAKLPILQQNANVRLRISGHCDERGSDEYNLALGMRRANAAKQYLVDRGIDPSRIEVVSFGEERPVDAGHSEDAWARNRRAEFEIVGGL